MSYHNSFWNEPQNEINYEGGGRDCEDKNFSVRETIIEKPLWNEISQWFPHQCKGNIFISQDKKWISCLFDKLLNCKSFAF